MGSIWLLFLQNLRKGSLPSGTFDKTIDLPFENLSLPAPEKFDTILTQFYGDYMTLPPEENASTVMNFTLINWRIRMQYLEKKEIKEIQLALLDYIDETCKKHDIPYFLSYGTMLGAIRHKGMIPWDDDIDISFIVRIMSVY